MKPTKSLHYFLDRLIDYAGLFPPAKLDIEHSLANYADYIKSKDEWMISQFIIPVFQLREISEQLMEKYSEEYPLVLSLISGDISNEIETVNQFLKMYGNSSIFKGYESRILNLSELPQSLESSYQLGKNQKLNFNSFYELPPSDNWVTDMNKAVSIISEFNVKHNANIGFKLRCGGVDSHMFPNVENIVHTILLCRDLNLPMKFTAGLHHPIRSYSESVKTKMYGFFNIFIGGMIAHKFSLEPDALISILIDENPKNFTFNENGLNWKSFSVSNSEIQKYRKESFISYGSCSFHEPKEDLQQLGLL